MNSNKCFEAGAIQQSFKAVTLPEQFPTRIFYIESLPPTFFPIYLLMNHAVPASNVLNVLNHFEDALLVFFVLNTGEKKEITNYLKADHPQPPSQTQIMEKHN